MGLPTRHHTALTHPSGRQPDTKINEAIPVPGVLSSFHGRKEENGAMIPIKHQVALTQPSGRQPGTKINDVIHYQRERSLRLQAVLLLISPPTTMQRDIT